MKGKLFPIATALAILLAGCNTYKTFYSPTFSDIASTEKIYRLDLSVRTTLHSKVDLGSLHDLRALNLSGQAHLNVDSVLKALPEPQKLQVLILDSLQLRVLPKVILTFKNLEHLSLNQNPSLDLNESLALLTELPIQFLNLQHNGLNEIPPNICLIQSIRDLNLSHNHLQPADLTPLSELPALRSFWIQHNGLTQLPSDLGKLVQLQKLYIEHNRLTHFPAEIVQLKKLMVLHAGHNDFEELPPLLTQMPFLFLLHIGNCPIARIPKAYDHGDFRVKGLIMSQNKLSAKERTYWKKKFNNFFALAL